MLCKFLTFEFFDYVEVTKDVEAIEVFFVMYIIKDEAWLNDHSTTIEIRFPTHFQKPPQMKSSTSFLSGI